MRGMVCPTTKPRYTKSFPTGQRDTKPTRSVEVQPDPALRENQPNVMFGPGLVRPLDFVRYFLKLSCGFSSSAEGTHRTPVERKLGDSHCR